MSLLHPILSFLLLHSITIQVSMASNFTATFFFGDSTVDTGNNKFIPTPFVASHTPYGLNFPNQTPTGRFSDGLLVADLLTSSLNIKPFSPPYLDPSLSDEEIRTGVNFASAGSGYDDLTSMVSNSVPMSAQLRMFEEYLGRLEGVVGEEERRRVVEGALVLFSAGGNDVIFNFYDLPRRRGDFDMSGYQDFLHGILMDAVKINRYVAGPRSQQADASHEQGMGLCNASKLPPHANALLATSDPPQESATHFCHCNPHKRAPSSHRQYLLLLRHVKSQLMLLHRAACIRHVHVKAHTVIYCNAWCKALHSGPMQGADEAARRHHHLLIQKTNLLSCRKDDLDFFQEIQRKTSSDSHKISEISELSSKSLHKERDPPCNLPLEGVSSSIV